MDNERSTDTTKISGAARRPGIKFDVKCEKKR